MKLIAHLYYSVLNKDSRSFRAAKAVLTGGLADQVLLLGHWRADLPEVDSPMTGVTVRRLRPTNGMLASVSLRRTLAWPGWSRLAQRVLIDSRPCLVHCHGLASLYSAVATKRVLGVPLIYDARELETERNGWGWLPRQAAKRIEARLIREADDVLVVSDSIATWYRDAYGLNNVTVVRNVPERPALPILKNRRLRDEFGFSDDDVVFVYLGLLGRGRGVSKIIEAFKDAPADKHMVFVGEQSAGFNISRLVDGAPNVHWRPAVPISEVLHYAAGADVGVSLIEDTCLSYRYCLPNKIHEYRLAGLPVIVSDLPELVRFVSEAGAGWVVPCDSASLAQFVRNLSRDAIAEKRPGIRQPPVVWDDEKERYTAVVERLLHTVT